MSFMDVRLPREHKVVDGRGGNIACVFVALFVVSFFLDDIIRARTQAAMNQRLKGYHVALGRAHLQLVGGRRRIPNRVAHTLNA
jgi:hypothetical protein